MHLSVHLSAYVSKLCDGFGPFWWPNLKRNPIMKRGKFRGSTVDRFPSTTQEVLSESLTRGTLLVVVDLYFSPLVASFD